MTSRTVAVRFQPDGGVEVVRTAKEIEATGVRANEQIAAAAQKAQTAAERQEAQWRRNAEAIRAAGAAADSQARFNAALGVGGSGKSASDAASVFIANDNDVARANAIRASIDPLWAAQNRYNEALEETRRLRAAGILGDDLAIQRENQLQQELNQTAEAIKRNNGLTSRQINGRLNITRQVADIGVTGAMGMNPAMIAIQQGPQLLEAMTDAGIKLTPVMIGVGAAIGAAAVGVAALAAGWAKGSADAAAYERAASGIGRTAGLNAEQLRALVEQHARTGEVSISSARDQAAAYLATGRIGGEVIGELIDLGRDYAAFMGVDAADATTMLAKAMLDPKKAGEEMTRTFGLLTQAELDQIDAAMKAGDQAKAQKLLLEALDRAIDGHVDKVGEITNAWDWVTRSISDAITKFGEWVYVTRTERIAQLERQLEEGPRTAMMGATGPGTMPNVNVDQSQSQARAELDRLRAEEARDNAQAGNRTAQATANQAAQLAADRARASEREGRQAALEAEREARQALQRDRREEDRASRLNIDVARMGGRPDRVQALEDEVALRERVRQLVDDGMAAGAAETKALGEQARLLEARAEAVEREAAARWEGLEVQAMLERGDYASAEAQQDRIDRQEVFNTQLGIWKDLAMANLVTDLEMVASATARADAMERSVKAARDEHQLNLARLAGRDREVEGREMDQRIETRAREIERREKLDRGDGEARARVEIREELDAEAEGVRRSWTRSFVEDIRQGGIRDALAEQFESATDRLLNKLVDGLFEIDWAALMGGGKGGGGGAANWISKGLDWLIGRNADGTDYWRGGLTWVGERGPELINAPRGAQIFDHGRSLRMLASATAGAGQTVHYHLNGNLLTPEFWDMIQRGDRNAAAAGASRGAQSAVGFVQGAGPSIQHGDRMMKG